MTDVPASALPAHSPIPEPDDRFGWSDVRAAVRRYWRLIAFGSVVGGGVALVAALRTPDVYRASTTLRLDRLSAAANSPQAAPTGLGTELELLVSRSLVSEAVRTLRLQVRPAPRRGFTRELLIESIEVDSAVVPGDYTIGMTVVGNRIGVMNRSRVLVAAFEPGDTLRFAGVTLVLRPVAEAAMPLVVRVRSLDEAVNDVGERLMTFQPPREAELAVLQYEDTDSVLVAEVANAIARRFVNSRAADQIAERRRTIELLAEQRDTVAAQLASAEQELEEYRRQNRVVNSKAASGTQVSRLVTLQTDRATLEAERGTLERLLEQADRRAARSGSTGPSPYRELLGFPALLKGSNEDLVAELARAEQDQSTAADGVDSQAFGSRRREVERRLRGVAATYLEGLTAEVRSIDSSIAVLDRQLSAVPRQEFELAQLERRPKVLAEIHSLLETRLKEAELTNERNARLMQVVDPAVTPQRSVRPNRLLIVGGGIAGGLIAGLLAALVRRMLTPAVRSRRDVRAAVGLPVLGLVPRLATPKGRLPLVAHPAPVLTPPEEAVPQPVVHVSALRHPAAYTFFRDGGFRDADAPDGATNGADSTAGSGPRRVPVAKRAAAAARVGRVVPIRAAQPMVEAYAAFQTNLLASRLNPAARTLLLTSPLAGDGKTTCALNLAVSLALRGLRVVLLDADLRRGRVHEAFEAPAEPGLAEVLAGRFQYGEVLHTVQVGDDRPLDYLTRGRARLHPTGLLESSRMRTLLSSLASVYDVVILDSPPANVLTDAVVLGAVVDEVVIVARAGTTDAEALRYAREQLDYVRAPLAGVLLNDIEFAKDVAYDPAYRFHALSDTYFKPNRQD